MNIVVLDITGRNASQYNPSLCTSINQENDNIVTLLSPTLYCNPEGYRYKKLIKIIPDSLTSSESIFKRILRLLEISLNYLYLIVYLIFKRPDILHIQWLPLLEFMRGETFILKIIKLVSQRTKIVLTVHNIYPHNMTDEEMLKYNRRFLQIDKTIDAYIVHLFCSKQELVSEFGILEKKIHVAYHGIYVAKDYTPNENADSVKRIIMYGYQNHYKGTDLLIEAIKILPEDYLRKIRVTIVGKTDPVLYEKYWTESEKLNVKWNNTFVSDNELYDAIGCSDLILLPYRKISQSGVLLLALSYKKPIITSDLPSFRETLYGYPNDYFFKANDKNSLAEILKRYIDGLIDENIIKNIIEQLNIKYSWKETGKKTIEVYNSCLIKDN